ncbi:MAG: Maf family protein [Candidatus Micrarchaeota archaeon]
MEVLLSSSSPRRALLLRKIVGKFASAAPKEPKHLASKLGAREESLRMAIFKAEWAAIRNPGVLVIGADTLVQAGRQKLEKPKNAAQARRYLRLLSGSRLYAFSSCCICVFGPGKKVFSRMKTRKCTIKCKKISRTQIENYLKSKKWEGKAGGFNILEEPASKWMGAKKADLDAIAGLETAWVKRQFALAKKFAKKCGQG